MSDKFDEAVDALRSLYDTCANQHGATDCYNEVYAQLLAGQKAERALERACCWFLINRLCACQIKDCEHRAQLEAFPIDRSNEKTKLSSAAAIIPVCVACWKQAIAQASGEAGEKDV